MKANEAPKKLYVDIKDGFRDSFLYGYVEKRREDYIEYTRTDVFIKKVCKFLNKEIPITDLSSSNMLNITFKVFDKESKRCLIERFKKYMKEE